MASGLKYSPINRNLQQTVKFFGIELEDLLFTVVAALAGFILGQFLFPNRNIFGMPMNWFLFLAAIGIGAPGLMMFKYGKPRGYLIDLLLWQIQDHSYGAAERSTVPFRPYYNDYDEELEEKK